MNQLDQRLDGLLQHRKSKGRFRSLKEYDTNPSGLIDFVGAPTSCSIHAHHSLRTTTYPSLLLRHSARPTCRACPRLLISSAPQARVSSLAHQLITQLSSGVSRPCFDSPDAILFNSGWDANVSFFSTVPQPGDIVIYDELIHASVHSGLRSSRISPDRRIPFAHNDPVALREVLDRCLNLPGSSSSIIYLALESLYSMDGDFCSLTQMLDVLDDFIPRDRQCVVLDEAHTTGLYGEQGRGLAWSLGEQGGWDMSRSSDPSMRPLRKERVTVRLMTFWQSCWVLRGYVGEAYETRANKQRSCSAPRRYGAF